MDCPFLTPSANLIVQVTVKDKLLQGSVFLIWNIFQRYFVIFDDSFCWRNICSEGVPGYFSQLWRFYYLVIESLLAVLYILCKKQIINIFCISKKYCSFLAEQNENMCLPSHSPVYSIFNDLFILFAVHFILAIFLLFL